MNPTQAAKALHEMGVTTSVGIGGRFMIYRPPNNPKDFPTFVKAIKTLGAWSVPSTVVGARAVQVRIECGCVGDELVFKIEGTQDA
jgi:hypothetical protein